MVLAIPAQMGRKVRIAFSDMDSVLGMLHTRQRPKSNVAFSACVLLCAITRPIALGVTVGSTDFIVAGATGDNVAVFDANFVFKGNLITNFDLATGLDFDSSGNIVAVAIGDSRRVVVFDRAGQQIGGFTNHDLGGAIDIKVGPDGHYYVATQNYEAPAGLIEFSPTGSTLRLLGNGDYEGVAMVPGNRLWAGGGSDSNNFLYVYNIATGSRTGTVAFDHGQDGASPMYYSAATNTVLICDGDTNAAYERELTGAFVRAFATAGMRSPGGVTRGPNGDVYISDQLDHRVYRFHADGTFANFIDVTTTARFPENIIWAGNVPEPALPLSVVMMSLLLARRRKFKRGH